MRIVVIHSGTGAAVLRRSMATREWEGYYENARSIAQALDRLGHSTTVISDGLNAVSRLARLQPDLAWVCSGGIQGHDQACHLPSLLESLGIPYVGSTPLAAGLCDDKSAAKTFATRAGVDTPKSIGVKLTDPVPDADFTYPVVIKPNHGLCSCGVTKAFQRSGLVDAVARLRAKYCSTVLIESYVNGRDISVPMLQRRDWVALPPVERFFRWDTSPFAVGWERSHPASEMLEGPACIAELPAAIVAAVCDASRAVCAALGIRHFARIDFRLDGSRLFFLEANHKPDFTERSHVALSAAAVGIEYEALIQSVLEVAWNDTNHTDCPANFGGPTATIEDYVSAAQ